jgi:hypothetical protein
MELASPLLFILKKFLSKLTKEKSRLSVDIKEFTNICYGFVQR